VDRAPQRDKVTERRDNLARVALKPADDLLVLPRTLLRNPERVGEVVQRDHRLDAARSQPGDHLSVAPQRRIVPHARLRLDAAPLNREPVRILIKLNHAVEVFFGAVPPVARTACTLVLIDKSAFLLRCKPIVVREVTFYLVRGGGGPPPEGCGEPQFG